MHVAFPCAQMSRHKNTNKVSISPGGIKDPADKETQFVCTRCRRRRKSQSLSKIKRQSSNPQSVALLSYHDRLFLQSAPRRRMSATYGLTNSYIAARWMAVVSCSLHQLYFPAKWLFAFNALCSHIQMCWRSKQSLVMTAGIIATCFTEPHSLGRRLGYRARKQRSHGLTPARGASLLQSVQIISGAQPASNTMGNGKSKAIPVQAWRGTEGSRRLRLPHFQAISTWRW